MTDIPINASIACTDGDCGVTTNVIVNPVNHTVTHVAIHDDKLPDNPTRLVPVANVAGVEGDRIMLGCTKADVAKMAPFVQDNLVQQSPSPSVHASSYASSYVFNDAAYDFVPQDNLPEGAMSVVSGMKIEATDGRVGKLDELVLDPESGQITHILMREGHLWHRKQVAVPIEKIGLVAGDTIFLDLDKDTVEGLPDVKTRKP